ncbi:MAG: DMT family transporter [Planctomycetota bacterium]
MAKIVLLLVVVTLISGLTPIAARLATHELPPLTLAVARFGTAGCLLAATVRIMGLRLAPFLGNWTTFLFLGLLCVPVNQVAYLFGLRMANASHAGIAYALVPVMVFWISLALGRVRLTGRMVVASTLASLGAIVVVLVTSPSNSQTDKQPAMGFAGDLLLLTAALSWSCFAIFSQPVVRRFGAIQTLATVFLVGTALHVPLAILDYFYFDLSEFRFATVTWRGLVGFAFITFITAYTNYLLWYLVVARFDVTRSTVVTNMNFLVTVLLESYWFGQALSGWVAAGSAILVTGIVMSVQGRRAETPPTTPRGATATDPVQPRDHRPPNPVFDEGRG